MLPVCSSDLGGLAMEDKKKIRLVDKSVYFCTVLCLICSFAPLNVHGNTTDFDIPEDAMDQDILTYAEEVIIDTMEIDDHLVDCVDIYKQPSLQHPLLVNHTIQANITILEISYNPSASDRWDTKGIAQLKPIFSSEMEEQAMETSHLLNMSRSCPEGTIPIEKFAFGPASPNLDLQSALHQRAVVRASGDYFGAKADLNVWNPLTEKPTERTSASIWAMSADLNTRLRAGWMVYPSLYGSDKVRFFISWTANGKGCFNFNCRGFVQIDRQVLATTMLESVSQYLGQQFYVTVEIIKDAIGNWWVRGENHDIGYWPKELVPALDGGAQWMAFGGEVVWDSEGHPHTATDMGSGRYSGGGFGHAAYFRNVIVRNPSLISLNPVDAVVTVSHEECYDLKIWGTEDPYCGYFFYYGGPGRSDKCT